MSTKKTSKNTIIVLSSIIVVIVIACVSAFLFIPRKSNQPLLPNTLRAIEAFPDMKIADKNFTFPKEGIKVYLDLNTEMFGGNNAYEKNIWKFISAEEYIQPFHM